MAESGAIPNPDGAGEPIQCAPITWGSLSGVLRLTYRTVTGRGELASAAAIVCLPDGDPPADGWPVVAWDHGTSGLGQDCGLTGSLEIAMNTSQIIGRLNAAGFAVVAPDYLGLSPDSPGPHPYLHTMSEGTATIDAVRAARTAVDGLSQAWAVAGESQGGHAALATAYLATRRAPELDFVGTVAVSPASNIEAIFRLVRPGVRLPLFPVGSFAAVLTGMMSGQSDVDVASYLTSRGRQVVDEMSRTCSAGWESVGFGLTAGDLISQPLIQRDFSDALRRYMKVPTSGYDAPILIVHGLRDIRVPLPLTLALLAQFALHGTRFRFRLVDAGHNTLLLEKGGIDLVVDYLTTLLPVDRDRKSYSTTKSEM